MDLVQKIPTRRKHMGHKTTRSDWTAAAHSRETKNRLYRRNPQRQHTTEQQQPRQRPHLPPPVQMHAEQLLPLQRHRRSAEAEAQGERKARRARGMVPKPSAVFEQSMEPEPSVLLEPEDIPIQEASGRHSCQETRSTATSSTCLPIVCRTF